LWAWASTTDPSVFDAASIKGGARRADRAAVRGPLADAAGVGAAEARTLADRGDEHAALASGVREELGNRVVVEREAGGTETVRVGAQV
jgi:hypothetical protein